MSEITVTRADREAVEAAYVPHGTYNSPECIGAWAADEDFGDVPEIDEGEDAIVEWHVTECRVNERERLQALAAAIAKARAEGFADGRAQGHEIGYEEGVLTAYDYCGNEIMRDALLNNTNG